MLCIHVAFPPVFENFLEASGDKRINFSDRSLRKHLMFHSLLIKFPEKQGVSACAVVNIKKSISMKYRLLESHAVVMLATLLAAVKGLMNLLVNFYFVISLRDHTCHWLEDGTLM